MKILHVSNMNKTKQGVNSSPARQGQCRAMVSNADDAAEQCGAMLSKDPYKYLAIFVHQFHISNLLFAIVIFLAILINKKSFLLHYINLIKYLILNY